MTSYPQSFDRDVAQPEKWEIHTVDGVFIKQMYLAKSGYIVPQHVHEHDHNTMLATGSVRVWIDKQDPKDYASPTAIFVAAGKQHTFMALEPNTVLYCIHKLRDGEVSLIEEGEL